MTCQFGSVFLTGLPWQESISEAKWEYEAQTEVVGLIGATEPFFASRGNARDSVSFQVSRQFATAEEAAEYCIDEPWSLPIKDTLILSEGAMTRTYANALLISHTRSRVGVSVFSEYKFLTGEPS
jgi:hypothetical protein